MKNKMQLKTQLCKKKILFKMQNNILYKLQKKKFLFFFFLDIKFISIDI